MTEPTMTKESTDKVTAIKRLRSLFERGRPVVMGVLNVTPDSFSDGGQFVSVKAAVDQALAMQGAGADIIDIGGESSRPGAAPVSSRSEQARVLPVIEAIRQRSDILISIDSYHADTARLAIDAGAEMVNDISALRFDEGMADVVKESGVPVVLMHMLGEPRTMQDDPHYEDCVEEIFAFFEERLARCKQVGIDRDKIILDPGIGFGKRLEDNLVILANLERFKQLGLPLMVGASRKAFIEKLNPTAKIAGDRLGGSVAAALTAVAHGADIIRVHDVAATVEAIRVFDAIRRVSW